MDRPEDTIDGSLDEWIEGTELRPHTSLLLVRMHPNWLSIPMLISGGIAGKRFLKFGSVVEFAEGRKGKCSWEVV